MTTSSLPTGWHGSAGSVATPAPVGWRNAALLHPTVQVAALHPVPAGTAERPTDAGSVAADEPSGHPGRSDHKAGRDGDRNGMTAARPAVSRETFRAASTSTTSSPLADELVDRARRREALNNGPVLKPAQPRVLTVSNQKGGVGKTTTTVNVAAALAQFGMRVLVIDIDPQGNASTALGIPHHAEVPSVYDVIVEDDELAGVLQECPDIPGLWCAPATIDLAGAELELVSLVARESRLKRAIDHYQEHPGEAGVFDFILIDCPPSLGLLTVNAFVAAREVFIPIQCEYYALEGLSQLLKNIELIRAHLNPELHVSTILLTMYDARTRLSAQVADEVRSHFGDQVLKASIPRSVRISEAPSHGQTVLTYDPSSSGALSYAEAAKELTAAATTIAR